MSSRFLGIQAFAGATMLVAAAVAQDPAVAQEGYADAPAVDRFEARASEILGVSVEDVALGFLEGPIRYENLSLETWVRSAVGPDGTKAVVALFPDGGAADLETLDAIDVAAGLARRGRVTKLLEEAFVAAAPGERLLAVAWVRAPDVEDLRVASGMRTLDLDRAGVLSREVADAEADDLQRRIAARIGPVTGAAAAAFRARGLEVVSTDVYAPLVFVRLSAAEAAALQADPAVESLDFAGQEYGDRLNVAVGEVRANGVWSAAGGVTGVGAKVSIVESTRVCSTNPYLVVSATKNLSGSVGSHTTGVGSCVASTHGTYKGVAPGSTLLSANGADFVTGSTNVTSQMPGSVSAVSWSVTNGAHVMNLSYGAGNPGSTVSSFDKYLDYVARNSGKTICVACGNSGQLAGYAGDPGAGYNQVAVGNFNDANSTAWSGEFMEASSSWKNPSTGVETPQVAAPGGNVTMLTCASPWTGYTATGTSFSSPITAGAAALVVAMQAGLGSWPEAIRAILMATAWHNIEGAATLSSKDGAGGLDALAAFRVAARGLGVGYAYGTLTTTSFDGAGFYTAQTASATAGQTVRVCLSFDSTPSGGPTYSPNTLKADLDLYVYGPTGSQVATSLSGNQPFEIVQFAAPSSGTYTVKIHRYSFTGTSEYFGTAFSVSSDA